MPKAKRPQLRIGISGWTYAPWRGVFYPKDVAQTKELQYASRQVNSIEINGTFYSLQRPTSYQKWHDATPDDFVFALKGPRYITHICRLKEVREPLANFFASGVFNLKSKLGPLLWQLPPNMQFDAEIIEAFCKLLPRDTASAAALAKKHHTLKKDGVSLKINQNRPLRHAIEVRHVSFAKPAFVDILRKHNIALVIADTAGKWPFGEDITADFVYLRLHGDEELYVSGYTKPALDRWAKRIKQWSTGKQPSDAKRWSKKKPPKANTRDVFVYFDNDVKVKSPSDAMSLAYRLGKSAQGKAVIGKENTDTPKLTRKELSARVKSHWPAKTRRRGA